MADGLQALTRMWLDEDVFIIGGGPSLKKFNISLLQNRRVIGCNDAYQIPMTPPMVHFGDRKWYAKHESKLTRYKGILTTSLPDFEKHPTIYHFPRIEHGFWRTALGWNGNTGASAINLALLLGASRVFLLGFDMQVDEKNGESNWHPNPLTSPTNEIHYARYLSSMERCAEDAKNGWPDVEIWNLNPCSAMTCFSREKWGFFFTDDDDSELEMEVGDDGRNSC